MDTGSSLSRIPRAISKKAGSDSRATSMGFFLFREEAGEASLLDHSIVVVKATNGWRSLPFPFAAAIDPADRRLELFVYFAYYEGEKVVGYDISAGRLKERTRASCSL
jgi:hypothetical protein